MDILNRTLSKECLEMASAYPIVTLIGPRQSGKTTLVRSLFKDKPYISLENPDEYSLATEDPRGFLNRFENGAILDEIQRCPELLSYIQEIVDRCDKTGMYILTGSHQLSLNEKIAQSLAGRTAVLKLLPFSIKELEESNLNLISANDYIFHGGFPRIYKNNILPNKFFRDYVHTYVERDVRQMINIKDLGLFQDFLKLCAGRIGQVFNSQSLGNDLGLSHHTVQSWLSILEASFIIFKVRPYFENFGKRVIKSPKIYFTDLGLACYLLDIYKKEQIIRDPLRGSLFENFVILEIFKNKLNSGFDPKLYYFRDSNGHEVDLILKTGNHLVPIEIKASETFNIKFVKELKYFKELAGDKVENSYVVYAGQQQQDLNDIKLLNFKNLELLKDGEL